MAEPADDLADLDPGLSQERTNLAWTRTAISFAALGVAILKFRPLIGVPIMIFSVVIWSLGLLSRRRRNVHVAKRMLLVTIAVTALALAALALTLFGHPSSGIRL